MKQHTNKPLKSIAGLALIAALSNAANAEEVNSQSDNDGTYWGIGIGSVLGAVIAGPPGAAIGATLGGSVGWGSDKNDALDESLTHLDLAQKALETNEMALRRSRSDLHKERQKVSELTRSNNEKSIELSNLALAKSQALTGNDHSLLETVTSHYQQEVFFKKGENKVPDYAQARIAQLSEFLSQHPNLEIALKGFADHTGSADFNERLAQARAESVRDMLVDNGIETQRIKVHSMGENNTIAQPGDSGNYILDRRVAIELSLAPAASHDVAASAKNDVDPALPEQVRTKQARAKPAQTTSTSQADISSETTLTETILAEAK